jgi:hypothetical protein
VNPNQDLVKAYFRESTTSTWIDKLPVKAARWSLFTGAGVVLDLAGAGGVGTLAGVAVSAFNDFVLEKLARGWKPNQFIEGPLKKFVRSES